MTIIDWKWLRDDARAAKRAGDFARSAMFLKRALGLAVGEPDDVQAALCNALADACRRSGDLDGALVAAHAGLASRQKSATGGAGGSDALIGNDLMMIALIHSERSTPDDRELAIDFARKARTHYVAVYGESHSEIRFIDSFLENRKGR